MHTALVFFAGLFVGYGIACLMGCTCSEKDDGVENAAREAKRKGLHPELN